MKIKGIELMQMIANGKVNKNTIVTVDNYNKCSLGFVFEDSRNIFKWLDEDFEIVEDETKDIEEIDTTTENTLFIMECFTGITEKAQDWNFNILKDKINELVRAYNSLIKQVDTSKETNCMSE